jgi:hypothetical protein
MGRTCGRWVNEKCMQNFGQKSEGNIFPWCKLETTIKNYLEKYT